MEDQILRLIRNSGLSRIANEITNLLMYSIRMRLHAAHEEALAIGASKVGGLPDLPPERGWPEWNGVPLSFIAQIHLPDIASYDREGALPHTGTLYFFCVDEGCLFSDPGPGNGGYVLYDQSDVSRLLRISAPAALPDKNRFTPCVINFSLELTLPAFESAYLEHMGLDWDALFGDQATPESQEECERYMQLGKEVAQLYSDERAIHRLLGYSDPIQAERMPVDWRLLLQIDSDAAIGTDWGDTGRLYYWIPRHALAARAFEQIRLELQCT